MQIDMHFYGVYALARAAGLEPSVARTIAQASQFVDDATEDEHSLIGNRLAIVPTMTSHRPLDYKNALPGEQWKVWIPFHFLPGDDPTGDTFVERMVTLPGSRPARKMLDDALLEANEPFWPHLIGIAAHVYADTYAHFGFVGYASEWNKVDDSRIRIRNVQSRTGIYRYVRGKLEEFKTRFVSPFVEMVPVGHGAVATLPDRPYLEWSFAYQTHPGRPSLTRRQNPVQFLTACRELHRFFRDYARHSAGSSNAASRKWATIRPRVRKLLELKKPGDERILAWKQAIAAGLFCEPTEADAAIRYDDTEWLPRSVRHTRNGDQQVQEMDACRYIRAAHRHRDYVLHELLPGFGLAVR